MYTCEECWRWLDRIPWLDDGLIKLNMWKNAMKHLNTCDICLQKYLKMQGGKNEDKVYKVQT